MVGSVWKKTVFMMVGIFEHLWKKADLNKWGDTVCSRFVVADAMMYHPGFPLREQGTYSLSCWEHGLLMALSCAVLQEFPSTEESHLLSRGSSHLMTGQWWGRKFYKGLVHWSQYGTTTKFHPRSRAPLGSAEAFVMTSLQFNPLLCPIPLLSCPIGTDPQNTP